MRARTSPALLMLLAATRTLGQDRTTEAEEAAIDDPVAECVAYSYAPVQDAILSFPGDWTAATILPNDSAARTKFDSFSADIPKITPRGTLTGDTSKVTYDNAADPDCWWTKTLCTTPKLSGLKADIVSVPEPRTLGYGFDDGPSCEHNCFYDYLAQQQQKATMFFIGSNVLGFPLEAQRAVTDGHEICVHTWSHPSMTAATNEGAFAELWYTMQIIKLVTNITPTCWRPPRGDVDDRIRYIAEQLGLETIMWGFDAFDWQANVTGPVTPADVQSKYDDLMAKAGQGAFDSVGAIILTHELNNYTMQTAIDNYPKLVKAFDHIVPVGVAQNKTHPYQETTYTQPDFSAYIANRTRVASTTSSNSSTNSSLGSQTTGTGAAAALRVPVLALALALAGAAWLR